jgi:hypothetical protein
MLIRTSTWDKVLDQFSDHEKDALRAAYQGEAICPRGWCIDEERLPPAFREKLGPAVRGRGTLPLPFSGGLNL